MPRGAGEGALTAALCAGGQAMLQAGLIVAGWDAREGGAVYGVPLGGTLVRVPFTIGAP
jgi:20S proteasome subunit beta 1